MNYYQKQISVILNITDISIINEVEDLMREHEDDNSGCLDHLSNGQFKKSAKLAHKAYLYMQTEDYKKEVELFYQ